MMGVKPEGGSPESGFALALVLWTLAIVSIVALTLATEVRSEVQAAIGRNEGLRAELLAESGLAFADYLGNRRLGSQGEELSGVPVRAITPGFHYRVTVPEGDIDLYFEGEDGKIDLSVAGLPQVESFFSQWTGDSAAGVRVAAELGEFRSAVGGRSRTGGMSLAAPLALNELSRPDLVAGLVDAGNGPLIRPGLFAFVTTDPTGAQINPNLAPRRVLMSMPGLSEAAVDAILDARRQRRITDLDELVRVAGPLPVSAARDFRFGGSGAPAILAIGRPDGGPVRRSIRRVSRFFQQPDPRSGLLTNTQVTVRTERNVFPEFADR